MKLRGSTLVNFMIPTQPTILETRCPKKYRSLNQHQSKKACTRRSNLPIWSMHQRSNL